MKQLITLLVIFLGVAAFTLLTSELKSSGGSPGGKTGSPGDGNTCTQCHGGTANAQTGWITSDVPAGGYIPGQTYTITATATHTGVNLFGFELTAEDGASNKAGVFTATNTSETQVIGGGSAITHTSGGTTPSGNIKTWTFDWTAPQAGTGDVNFYAAFNAANGNGTTSGDVIYTSDLLVNESSAAGFGNLSQRPFNIYPNPASDHVFISAERSGMEYFVTDASGKMYLSGRTEGKTTRIDIQNLEPGMYFLFQSNRNSKAQKILVR